MPITKPSGNTQVITPNNSGGTSRPVILFSGTVTNSDLDTASNGITRSSSTGIYKIDGDVYFTDTCDLSDFGNITLDIGDKDFYVHPDAPDTTLRNVTLRMTGNRAVSDRAVFKEGSQYNAIGGGFIHAAIDRPAAGDRRYLSVVAAGSISNVQLRAEDYALQEIDALTFLQSGEYSGIRGTRVKRVSADNGTTRLLLHDCDFNSSVLSSGTQIGCYHNANAMLNDCTFLRYSGQAVDISSNDWLDTYSTATDQPQYIYLMGTTSSLLKTNWANRSRNNQAIIRNGSLKYLQAFLGGVPTSQFNYRVYSRLSTDTDAQPRPATPTLTNSEMLLSAGSTAEPVNGAFAVAIIKDEVLYLSGSWVRRNYVGHIIRMRDPAIIFNDYSVSAAQAIISQGRPDNSVPIVLQADPHANTDELSSTNILEINARISFDFSTRTATASSNRTWTPARLYAYYRFILSEPDNYAHPQEWTFDGSILNIGDWSLTFGNNSQLQVQTNKGTEIRTTTGQINPGTGTTNAGITLIDADGVSVQISSPIAGARAILKHGTTTLYHDLPFADLLPLNTTIHVTAKAPGFIYQKYTINTATARSLDVRLPRDPSIDLDVSYETSEINTVSLTRPSQGTLQFDVGAIFLGGQLEKSKRIIDALLSTNMGLQFLADYTDELSGSPLGGSPIVFETYRIRMDVDNDDMDGKIRFNRTATDLEYCRLGSPIHTPAGIAYRAPKRAGHGGVNFDNVILSNVDPAQITEDVVAGIQGEGALLHKLNARMQTEFDNIRLGFFKLDTIENNNYISGFVSEPDDIIMIRGTSHNGGISTVGDVIDKSDGQIKTLGDVSRHIYHAFTSDASLLSVCNFDDSGSKVFMLVHSTLGHQLVQVDRDGLIAAYYTNTTSDSRFALIRNDEAIVLRSVNGKLAIAVGNNTGNITGITPHWDFTGIDLAADAHPSAIFWEGKLYVLIGPTLYLFDYTLDSSDEINGITLDTSYTGYPAGSFICQFQDSLWLYKGGTFTPLDYTYQSITTEWDKFGDAVRQKELSAIESRMTAARAALLDNLDATISSRATPGGIVTAQASILATIAGLPTPPTVAEIRTEMETSSGYLKRIRDRVNPIRFDSTNHIEASIRSIKGTSVQNIDSFKATIPTIPTPPTVAEISTQIERSTGKVKAIEDVVNKFRFSGMADDAGTQKVEAEATVTGTVDSSGLTDAQASQLNSIYSETVIDSDNTSTNIKEGVDALLARITATRAGYLDAAISSRLATTGYTAPPTDYATATKLAEAKTAIDAIPTTHPAFPMIPTPPTAAEIRTELEGTGTKLTSAKATLDKFAFSSSNDVKATLDGEAVTTDADSRTASKSTGFATPANLLAAQAALRSQIDANETKIDAIKTVADSTKSKVDTNLDATVSSRLAAADYTAPDNADITDIKSTVENIETHVTAPTHDHDGDDTTAEVNTLLGEVKAIKDVAAKFGFNSNNDVKSTLDGEEVTTDSASRTASKATGYATPQNVTDSTTAIQTAINTETSAITGAISASHSSTNSKIDAVKAVTDAIKTETDKIQTIDDNVDTTVTQTTADAISSAVETAFLDDDDGRAFLQQILDKVEQAIEDESLAENALAVAIRREVWQHVLNPDDPEDEQVQAQEGLNNARLQINRLDMDLPTNRILLIDLAKAALDWLVRINRANYDITSNQFRFYDSQGDIISFTPPDGKAWASGRELDE